MQLVTTGKHSPLAGIRVYATAADRNRAIAQLRRHGRNYFTCFTDVHGYGLSYAHAAWVDEAKGPGGVWLAR